MDSTNGYSLSDIAAANGGMNGFGGEGLWIFALLLLLFGSNGFGFGGGNASNAVSQADLQRAIDLNSIQQGQASIEARVQEVGAENITATKDSAYNNLGEIRDVQAAVATGFANQQTCCCETNRNIDSVRFDLANYASAIQQNDTANTQKVLDAIAQSKIDTLTQQVNQLSMQQALCGVPRVNPYSYNLVPSWNPPMYSNNI